MTTQEINDRVRRNIDTVRSVRKLSAQRVADEGGFGSRQIVSDRLTGRTKITVDELVAFARVLNVPPAVLLEPIDFVFRHLSETGEQTTVVAQVKPTRKQAVPKATPRKRSAK
jgi:Predicted transcription regulator containing HTH domain